MIPVQLTLEGLYSYQERQCIDFSHLTEAGLFGIFGAVGSGKSSILEAISFALYGETERLNKQDKRAYNMMNLKANKSFIQFDFINHENKIFRVQREFRRNSKKFDDVKPVQATFYEKHNENWIPLEHSDCEKIIGLSYANFKRTIIIPQGQFKEFLELGATERTNMMKEIFSLQQYDLQNNASILNNKNTAALNQLEGQLKGFEDINEKNISIQNEFLQTEKQKFEKINTEFKKAEDHFRQLKNLKTDFQLLNSKKENFAKLLTEKEKVDALEAKTDLYDKISCAFNPLISEKEKLQSELHHLQKEQTLNAELLKETLSKVDQNKKEFEAVLPKYETLSDSKTQENDLNLIFQMLTYSTDIKSLKERTENGFAKVKEVENFQKTIKEKISGLHAQLENLRPKKLDTNLLLNVGNWFSEQRNLSDSFQKQTRKITEIKTGLLKIEEELQPFNIDPENFPQEFRLKMDRLESDKTKSLAKKSQLEVQKQLAHFVDELHDGKSCPLCGSLQHPYIVEIDDVTAEMNLLNAHLVQIDFQQKEIQSQISAIEKILERKKLQQSQLNTEEENLNEIKIQVEKHQNLFIWKEFNPQNETEFLSKKSESFAIEKQIDELQKHISAEQENLEKSQKQLDKFNEALQDFKLKEHEVETKITTNEANLKILRWNDYREKSVSEVGKLHSDLSKTNLETEQNYQNLKKQEQELAVKFSAEETTKKELKKRSLSLNEEISKNDTQINNALTENKFAYLHEIEPVLAQKIDVAEAKNQIQKFRIEFETLKNGISELETKLEGFNFDENRFTEAETQFKTLETEKTNANNAVIKISSEIDRLVMEFSKKETLLKEFSKLQKRAENLKIMTNLFKAAGFVQYVSSIYLRQLCDQANIRFHRMTRNQLSLQLNENNDFEIIDYLNEGRSRSVKTLSGGQAFQVSLSLALALAESVQTNARANKNFFFIDEGFGTQDLESVNVVFETLTSLQKENRIVGIISHVEELKEKIPVSLNIRKDEERGSLIEVM
ncbi:SbcC/MukB-like Walker B domain-containing protein [Kaistella sp.]|uniref:SbcC/MukB-like Walker B domain-containing protein n=1 Tax=Kaistella sp. TaxID=2782235 RepID=UPI002F952294